MTLPVDFDLHAYRYELDPARIAQEPAARRDGSRLLLLDRSTGATRQAAFADLPGFIPEGALLVVNNSKVLPARINGVKPTGGRMEFLLLTPLRLLEPQQLPDGRQRVRAQGLLKASKGFKPGQTATLEGGIELSVLEKQEFGRAEVELAWQGDLGALFQEHGTMPLPPYIHRPAACKDEADAQGRAACEAQRERDAERYQTVYAKGEKLGSVAAPTAGLHFTPEIRAALSRRCEWAEVTLYVGYGTFSPIRCRDIREHEMHAEFVEVSEETASAVNRAKAEGRPIVAVGTTSVRTLEGTYRQFGEIRPWTGWTNIFLYPGEPFHVVDHMVTNFHLPESSLIVMISAFAGRERVLAAYAEALDAGYRVFSYGDSMFIR